MLSMSTYSNIPTITNLVVAGDPRLKSLAQNNYSIPSHIDELNMRIDDIESAIGQDDSNSMSRAYAIRAENNYAGNIENNIEYIFPERELA